MNTPTAPSFWKRSALRLSSNLATLLLVCGGLLVLTGASPAAGRKSEASERRPNSVPLPTLGTYPATSVALSTNTTVTPAATPTGTTRMNVSTSTDFNGKLEGNPATGVVRVTDAHPAGTYAVTVKAFDIGGGSVSTTFNLTVRESEACDPPTFAPVTNFATGTNPSGVAVGDFNRDGQQDLAVTNFNSGFVSILLGNSAGGFTPGTNVPAATASDSSVAVGDFNGDGNQDLAVTHYSAPPTGILIFRGDGAGNFSAGTNLPAHGGPVSVAVGDFNRDGRPDLAAANQDSNDVSILLGHGDGSFSAAVNFGAGVDPNYVTTGDFNGDGKPDLAVANYISDDVSILLGDGLGGFSAPTNLTTDNGPAAIAVGDFNDDGKQDLAVANFDSNNVSIRLGDGMGGFSAATNFNANSLPNAIVAGDFNGDGKLDLAVANTGSNNVSLFLGDGAGSFGLPINLGTGTGPWAVAVGDFNGDGKQDLAVPNVQSNNVSILLDNCALSLGTYQDTSIPLSTDTTVAPDAMPTNITRMTVSSTTDFKGKLEGDPTTGVVRVTDAHPAGTHVVTVTGLSNTGVKTSTTCNLTVTTPGPVCTPVSFAPANNTTAGTIPRHIAVGDFNRDGKQDLVTANNSSNDVSILLGDGAGHVGPATNLAAGMNPFWVAVGDLNGDGKEDLAVADSGANTVSVLLGNGLGGFSAATTFTAGAGTLWVGVGDFNGDGKQDLATVNSGSANVSILLGDGTGTFGAATNVALGGRPYSAAIGDFNRDGNLDIVTSNYTTNNVSILLGDGAGHLSAPVSFAAGRYSDAVAVGDFNGDGKQDLATSSYFDAAVYVLLGNGSGGFGAATPYATRIAPFSVAVGDFNGDGKQDLALGTQDFQNVVSILTGDGAGHFGDLKNVRAGSFPIWVAVGDFNGDGVQDLATSNYESGDASVLLRNCNHAPVLDAGKSPKLNNEAQNAGAPMDDVGTLINNLVDFAAPAGQVDNVIDADAAVLGIAVTAADNSHGTWFYSIDDGDHWLGLGPVSDASARLLAADYNTRLYFQPNANYSGTLPGAITFRAWDQTLGDNGSLANTSPNGGGTAFSAANDTASLTINGPNQCMVCHKGTTTLFLPCNSLEFQRHLDHGDSASSCQSNNSESRP